MTRRLQAAYVRLCKALIADLLCPNPPLLFQIDHFIFEGKYPRLSLFATESVSLVDLADIIKQRESNNCEIRLFEGHRQQV